MVSVIGVLSAMWDLLAAMSPVGIEPYLFWLTLMLSFGTILLLLNLIPLFRERKGITAIVGFVMAYFVASSSFAVIIISKLFPSVGIVIMFLLGLLMLVAIISPKSIKEGEFTAGPVIIIIGFLIVIWITYTAVAPELAAAGHISPRGVGFSTEDLAAIIIIVVVLGVLWAVLRTPKVKEEPGPEKLFKWLFGKKW